MKFDYLKHQGDLAIAVIAEVGEELTCEWLYLHDSAPTELELCSPEGRCFLVDVQKLLKPTPVVYSGELKLCLITP